MSTEGKPSGSMRLEVWPLSRDGSEQIPEEELVDDPEDLVGHPFSFVFKIPKASVLGIYRTNYANLFCRYEHHFDGECIVEADGDPDKF